MKKRGECWRITALPTKVDEMRKMIRDSKLALSGGEEIPIEWSRKCPPRGERVILAEADDDDEHVLSPTEFTGFFAASLRLASPAQMPAPRPSG